MKIIMTPDPKIFMNWKPDKFCCTEMGKTFGKWGCGGEEPRSIGMAGDDFVFRKLRFCPFCGEGITTEYAERFHVGDHVRYKGNTSHIFEIVRRGLSEERVDCCRGCWELSGGFVAHESEMELELTK